MGNSVNKKERTRPRTRKAGLGLPPEIARRAATASDLGERWRMIATREGGIEDYYAVDWTRTLGRGRYATVHRGHNKETRRVVAIRRLKIQIARTRELECMESLKAEINALRAVGHHDNIVNLVDVFVDETDVMIVMELCTGGDLFDRLAGDGPRSEERASYHIACLASALEHMHSRGVVHCDIKPENLMFSDKSPDATLKIANFGVAQLLEGNEERHLPRGTVAYSAPEVKTSISADMWSLGVVLFTMLAAYHPFDPEGEESDERLRRNVNSGVYDFDDPVWHSISDGAKDLIRKLIVVDPEARLTARQVLEHPWAIATNWIDGQPPVVLAPKRPKSATKKPGRRTQAPQSTKADGAAATGPPRDLLESTLRRQLSDKGRELLMAGMSAPGDD